VIHHLSISVRDPERVAPEGAGLAGTNPEEFGYGPTHFALSDERSYDEALAIPTARVGSAAAMTAQNFLVIELWIENILMCEGRPPEFSHLYLKTASDGVKPVTA
jgi:hypothetical protein